MRALGTIPRRKIVYIPLPVLLLPALDIPIHNLSALSAKVGRVSRGETNSF